MKRKSEILTILPLRKRQTARRARKRRTRAAVFSKQSKGGKSSQVHVATEHDTALIGGRAQSLKSIAALPAAAAAVASFAGAAGEDIAEAGLELLDDEAPPLVEGPPGDMGALFSLVSLSISMSSASTIA